MCQVEVGKVRANIMTSFFPESLRGLCKYLEPFSQSERVHSVIWEPGHRTMNDK